MVKVREDYPQKLGGVIDTQAWVGRISAAQPRYKRDELSTLERACFLAQELEHKPGSLVNVWSEDYTTLQAGLEMAELLADLQMDEETLASAVLYRSYREEKISLKTIQETFGDAVAKLLAGVQRMAVISSLSNNNGDGVFGQQSDEQAENVRKMLIALVDDVRIALIKLAERTCAIRAVKSSPAEKRKKIAREVAEIYAPLAHRLGIGHIKWELEDLSFRYLHPFDYKYIAKLLDERRLDRQSYIEEVVAQIDDALSNDGISAEVSGRAKHIFSIWRKMKRKNIGFSEVYDIRAVRVLVDDERECYSALGIVHALWRNIPHEFDDYIANPKENGYRSLHTAVHGPENRTLEIQIRTKTMHEEAEFGVCAHWRYKDSDADDESKGYEEKIEWLRQVLEWHEDLGGLPWDDQLPLGMNEDRIYVFTPEGHVVDLPAMATPVDFAFRIHSDVGICCRGAKVNGRIVPLNQPLRTADQVEILTGKREAPSRDWLNSALGYVTTSKARSCLQQWFKHQDRDQNVADGRSLLDREFKRLAVDNFNFDALAKKLNLKSLDDLYAAVGTADLSGDRVLNAAQRLIDEANPQEPVVTTVGRASDEASGADVYIDGVGNLMSHIAQCCQPVPGERISGYITLGRGVSIHRQDCSNILQRNEEEPERIIRVNWAEKPKEHYSAVIVIEAFDRHGLLRDITTLLDREKVNVSALNTLSDKQKNAVDMTLTVEIANLGELSRILAKINQLPNVSSAKRQQ